MCVDKLNNGILNKYLAYSRVIFGVVSVAMNKNKASGVAWVKPTEPSFLKKFKNDVGYKEGPTVDTKVVV